MFQILLSIQVVVSIALIAIVLIQQKNVSLNLASMSWGMGTNSKRGPEKFLHNLTIIIGIVFIANSLALFLIA